MSTDSNSAGSLTASVSYKSPANGHFTITESVPAPQTPSATNKITYLQGLKAAVSSIQEQVNKQLTSRMEEDKARDAGKAAGKAAADEAKEEENYGEEVVEE
jgi:hypothetical protein